MMTVKECPHARFERIDVVLPDGFRYHYDQCPECGLVEYPPKQAQSLLEYSESHIFMFVEDWLVAWMSVRLNGEYVPIPGITAVQKQMFLLIKEFAPEHGIPSENPGFKAYRYGPYTMRIDRALQTLDELGYVRSKGRLNTNSEVFHLTDSGKERGEKLLSRFDDDTVKDLRLFKADIQQYTLDGLMTYVYSNYPDYTDRSEVFERVLHRKRSRRWHASMTCA